MKAKLIQKNKTAMQSGKAKTRGWLLVFEGTTGWHQQTLLKWQGTTNTQFQVMIPFETQEAALRFAQQNHILVEIQESPAPQIRPKSYADNFTKPSK